MLSPHSRFVRRLGAGVSVAALLASPTLAAAPPAVADAGRTPLPDPVPTWIHAAGVVDDGPAPSTTVLSLRLYLAGRSAPAEQAAAAAVSQPGGPAYGRYLSPAAFRAVFGPTPDQTAAVETWARGAGLTVTGADTHDVAVTGPAPVAAAALATTIDAFSNPSGLTGYAPTGGISVPASLHGAVSTVVGLDDFHYATTAAPAPSATTRTPAAGATGGTCSAWWGQKTSPIPAASGRTTAPDAVCGYTPQQLASAYGVLPDSGRGRTIAVVLDGSLATMGADANRFFADHGLPGFGPGQFRVDAPADLTSTCGPDGADVPEEPLDVETAHIIAPAARVVYVAADCGSTTTTSEEDFLDAETRIVDQHLGDVETDSYSTTEQSWTPAMTAAWSQVLEEGAVEGIGFDFDSGDDGDSTSFGGSPAVLFPASDPWATAVGGTTVEIGADGRTHGVLGWGDTSDEIGDDGYASPLPGSFTEGSTGGRSSLFAEPGYQRGTVPPALATLGGAAPAGREVPDVSADADPISGWLIGYSNGGTFSEAREGGTSGASPIVAALEADADAVDGRNLGFANPLLYARRTSAAITDVTQPSPAPVAVADNCYDDPTAPSDPCLVTLGDDGSLTEAPGYDDVTGVGTPSVRFAATIGAR